MTGSTCQHVTSACRWRCHDLFVRRPRCAFQTTMQTDRDEAAPPRKRARASSNIAGTGSLKRDNEFWYDDGTIVLVADNTEFRVYRGPLAKHSPVFRDMLALPQPPTLPQSTSSASEPPVSHHQCPTVHVTDSPSDLRHFLRAFVLGDVLECVSFYVLSQREVLTHQHSYFYSPRPRDSSTLTFDAVFAWIRLGHKYEVDKLVKRPEVSARLLPKLPRELLRLSRAHQAV